MWYFIQSLLRNIYGIRTYLRRVRDWRKLDLSIDIIGFAAPEVVNINLYWSRNETVLIAWACAEGIPRLYQNSKRELKKVILHASPVCSCSVSRA